MSAINELIDKIENEDLRDRIRQEVLRMQKQKKFGLVFEEHIPEATMLYDVPIKRGSLVAAKTGKMETMYRVLKVNGENLLCERLDEKHEKVTLLKSDMVSIARFGEPIYPYLKPIDTVCNAPDSDLWHTLIEADNYHALQLLVYLYGGKVDCIYIDPPYNSGARDWKYNNDYVDNSDQYRHSKWLSMMKKRLSLAKKLLNPQDSVLIVTIDEKEYLHIGCLLEELFPDANIQMVTTVISGKGVSRDGQFSRVEEYIFCVTIGRMQVMQLEKNMLNDESAESEQKAIDFLGFRRRNKGNYRTSRPNQFYPVIVDNNDGHIVEIGDAITPDINRFDVPIPSDCTGLWPLDPSGNEKIWSVVPESARILLSKGCLKVTNWDSEKKTGSVKYLASGTVEKIEDGTIIIDQRDGFGSIISGHYSDLEENTLRPRRVWNCQSHNASSYGTLLLKKFLITKRFDFPKSIYAVHDTIRFFVANKPDALIIDFFAGSGTTLHAVNLLNKEDGGKRRCIMVTNNEVSEEESIELESQGFQRGDEEWEKLGIARYVNWPRTKCSILGVDINNKPVSGDYLTYKTQINNIKRTIRKLAVKIPNDKSEKTVKQQIVSLFGKNKIAQSLVDNDCHYIVSDDYPVSILFDDSFAEEWLDELDGREHINEICVITQNNSLFKQIKNKIDDVMGDISINAPVLIPMSDGFKANAAFFKLGFLDKTEVALDRQFRELLPLLWMKAGAVGSCPKLTETEIPKMLLLPENRMAVLVDELYYSDFLKEMDNCKDIDTVFIITDSESSFKDKASRLHVKCTYQLYRDYLENFSINYAK